MPHEDSLPSGSTDSEAVPVERPIYHPPGPATSLTNWAGRYDNPRAPSLQDPSDTDPNRAIRDDLHKPTYFVYNSDGDFFDTSKGKQILLGYVYKCVGVALQVEDNCWFVAHMDISTHWDHVALHERALSTTHWENIVAAVIAKLTATFAEKGYEAGNVQEVYITSPEGASHSQSHAGALADGVGQFLVRGGYTKPIVLHKDVGFILGTNNKILPVEDPHDLPEFWDTQEQIVQTLPPMKHKFLLGCDHSGNCLWAGQHGFLGNGMRPHNYHEDEDLSEAEPAPLIVVDLLE